MDFLPGFPNSVILFDRGYPSEDMFFIPAALGIESKYREFKNRLEIEAFNSVKPVSIRQEFFAAMYLSNLAAIIKMESDSRIVASAERRCDYQSNRSYILNRIKGYIIHLLRSSLSVCSEMICRMVDESLKIRSIIRSDRKFGRYRKHTRQRYYNHMKSCI